METIPTENMEVDENGSEVSRYCLGLPTIVRKMLEHFSTKELLELSLVSKLWNFEARSVMRERGNVIANLWSGGVQQDDQCQRLLAFASDLEKMPVVPFSGIRYFVVHRRDCQLVSDGSLDPSYKVILDRLPWKHFVVRIYDDWERCKDCPALVLVKRILEDYCGVIEQLTLGHGREPFLWSICQMRSFPRLQFLDIQSGGCSRAVASRTSSSIKALVSSAPNLQELRVNDTIDLTVNVLEGSSAVLVPKGSFPLWMPICKALIDSFRAKSIWIDCFEIRPKLLNRIAPKLIEASRTTLESFSMDFLFAVPLMCYGICLENVTTLEIHMHSHLTDDIEPWILMLPMGLDFTRVFPKLKQVRIWNDLDEHDLDSNVVGAFIEQGNAVLSNALPDRAINIKLLKLDIYDSLENFVPLLAQMFPHVKTVEIFWQHPEYSLAQFREHFLSLEEVTEGKREYNFELNV